MIDKLNNALNEIDGHLIEEAANADRAEHRGLKAARNIGFSLCGVAAAAAAITFGINHHLASLPEKVDLLPSESNGASSDISDAIAENALKSIPVERVDIADVDPVRLSDCTPYFIDAGLDVVARNQILDLLREYMETPGRSILISSHIASDLENLCDSFRLISRGRILLAEDMDVLRDEYGYVKVPASLARSVDLKGMVCRKTNPDGSIEALVSDRQFYLDNYPHVLVERGGVDEALLLFEGADVVIDRNPETEITRKGKETR